MQGLFGILPDAMNERLVIRPGFPANWDYASIETPDIAFDFAREGQTDRYTLNPSFPRELALTLQLQAPYDRIKSITVNGHGVDWSMGQSVGTPVIVIACGLADTYQVEIVWKGKKTATPAIEVTTTLNTPVEIAVEQNIRELYDPQEVLESMKIRNNTIHGTVKGETGHRTLFIRVKEGDLEWWRPVSIEVKAPLIATHDFNWELADKHAHYEMVDMDEYLNASVDQIFTNEYLSPRSPYTTLQIPKQGIGEWCHPTLTAAINDSGLRKASREGVFETPLGIPFRTPSDESLNIAFTSLWDNYPSSVTIPLTGKASHAFLLMAGSTNHMQVHVPNGEVLVTYRDGTSSRLVLRNPESWVPIEQDLFVY